MDCDCKTPSPWPDPEVVHLAAENYRTLPDKRKQGLWILLPVSDDEVTLYEGITCQTVWRGATFFNKLHGLFSHLPSVVCLDFVKFLRCLCAPTFSIQDSFDEGFSSWVKSRSSGDVPRMPRGWWCRDFRCWPWNSTSTVSLPAHFLFHPFRIIFISFHAFHAHKLWQAYVCNCMMFSQSPTKWKVTTTSLNWKHLKHLGKTDAVILCDA